MKKFRTLVSIVVVVMIVFSFSSVALAAEPKTAEKTNAFNALKASGVDMQESWSNSGGDANVLGSVNGSCYFSSPAPNATYTIGANVPVKIHVNNRVGYYGMLGVFDANNKLVAKAAFNRIPSTNSIATLNLPTASYPAGKYTIWFFVTTSLTASTYVDACDVSFNVKAPVVVKPSQVTGVKVSTARFDQLKITWNKASNATKYEVYRSLNNGATYRLITTTTATSYTHKGLTPNQTVTYVVRGVNGTLRGALSAKVSRAPKLVVPSIPRAMAGSATGSTLLAWNASPYAQGYLIYRGTSLNGTYNRVTHYKNTGTGRMRFTDKGLKSGQRYYYYVRSYRVVNGRTYYSDASAKFTARAK